MAFDPDQLARAAYEAYRDAVHWVAYNGEPIPLWEEQDEIRKAGWRAAAERIHRHIVDL